MSRRSQVINHRETRIRSARRQYQFMTALRLAAHRRAILIPHLQVGLEVVGLSEIVNRGDIEEQIESEFGIVAQNPQRIENVLGCYMNPIVAKSGLMLKHETAQA